MKKNPINQFPLEWNQLVFNNLYKKNKLRDFEGRESYLEDIEKFITSEDKHYLVLIGNEDSGKSSILASSTSTFGTVIPIFCDSSPYIKNKKDLLHFLLYRLNRFLYNTDFKFSELNNELELSEIAVSLLKRLSKKTKVILFIDAPNIIKAEDIYSFLPIKDFNCKIIITSNTKLSKRYFDKKDVRTIVLNNLEETEIMNIISHKLSWLDYKISSKLFQKLVQKTRNQSPLYLSLVIDHIRTLSEFELKNLTNPGENNNHNIDNFILSEIEELPDSIDELIINIVNHPFYNKDFAFSKQVLQILSVFNKGVSLESLIGILKEQDVEVTLYELEKYLESIGPNFFLINKKSSSELKNHIIVFSNETIKNTLKKEFNKNLDEIYESTLRYFKKISNVGTTDNTIFLKSSIRHNDFKAIADYLVKLFYQKKNSTKLISIVIEELYFLLLDLDNEEKSYNFLNNLIKCIPDDEIRLIYDICNILLSSYKNSSTVLNRSDKPELILELLYKIGFEILYPNINDNPLYLRILYICCELLGLNTPDLHKKISYYTDFNKYCKELLESINSENKYYNVVLNDFSLSYSKLASLYVKRNWIFSLDFFDKAIKYAKLSVKSDPININNLIVLLTHYREKASCIIQKALQNKTIGEPLEELKDSLKEAKDLLLISIKSFKSININKAMKSTELAYCYLNLIDWARATDSRNKEIKYIKKMKKHAKRAYSLTHEVDLYDLIRNGEVRLALLTKNLKKKYLHLQKALLIAYEVFLELDNENSFEILYQTGSLFLETTIKLLKNYLSKPNKIDKVTKICLNSLNNVIPIVKILISGSKIDENYNNTIKLFQISLNNVIKQRKLIINNIYNTKATIILRKTNKIFKILKLLKNQINLKNWLSLMADVSYILSLSAHNSRVELIHLEPLRKELENIDFLEFLGTTELYNCILEYKMNFSEEDFIKKYQQKYEGLLFSDVYDHIAWIIFAKNHLKTDPDKFWSFLDKIHYSIPNYKNSTLYLLEQKKVKEYLTPQINYLGKYFYEHYNEKRIQKLLYLCTLFEDLTLEYAYQNRNFKRAKQIIENGYDRYLELPTLYIIYKYDRNEFYNRVNDLKFKCLKNHLRLLRHISKTKVFEDTFIEETNRLFNDILEQSKFIDPNDPRKHSRRLIYKFSRK